MRKNSSEKLSVMAKIAADARDASRALSALETSAKDEALIKIACGLLENRRHICAENAKDVADAEKKKMPPAFINRLLLDEKAVDALSRGIAEIAELEDPVGEVTPFGKRPNGLVVEKMRIPLGVIGIVYESRPGVTADAAALCLKSANAVILRGGSESIRSNIAIGKIIRGCLSDLKIPPAAVNVVADADRNLILEMLGLDDKIDLIIPRGGENLIRFVTTHSAIPVLKHYKGVCHIFVDESAKTQMATDICVNAKTQRPGVCNAMETMLVHEKIAPKFLPAVARKMKEKGVLLKACPSSLHFISGAQGASEKDWDTEHLGLVLNVRIVKNIDAAIAHIDRHGSMHTDAIVTQSDENARHFLRRVESSAVMRNVSTRFNDGFELGMGAEIGISTTKLHAFGPMGLRELTAEKFVVRGNGQIKK